MLSKQLQTFEVEGYQKALQSDEVQIVYTSRDEPLWIDELQAVVQSSHATPLQVWLINEPVALLENRLIDALHAFMVPADISVKLAEDVMALVEQFVRLTGDERPFVSFRTIDQSYFTDGQKSVSRNWHVDTSVLTLTCTYVGQGTEWTTYDTPEIRALCAHEKMLAEDAVSIPKDAVAQMQRYEVSVLKGEIRNPEDATSKEFLEHFLTPDEIKPFNVGCGILHRGPGYVAGDTRRLLLTVSSMRIPAWLQK